MLKYLEIKDLEEKGGSFVAPKWDWAAHFNPNDNDKEAEIKVLSPIKMSKLLLNTETHKSAATDVNKIY